jgi:hypothetical protein
MLFPESLFLYSPHLAGEINMIGWEYGFADPEC